MDIKGLVKRQETEAVADEKKYIPGSSEKKRATMMYFFFGIMVSISKKEFSPFEYYHLKQSIGLWLATFPMILLCLIPIIKRIAFIFVLALIIILVVCCANAWKGKYFENSKNAVYSLFSGVGGWFLDLFELKVKVDSDWVEQDKLQEQVTLADLQNEDTSLQEDVEKLESQNVEESVEDLTDDSNKESTDDSNIDSDADSNEKSSDDTINQN